MPHYDYRCDECGHELELFQRISESPRRKCPECGRQRLRRLIGGGAGVLFKGSGFYQTDYKSSAGNTAAGSAPTESSGKTTESSGKTSEPNSGAGKETKSEP